MGVEIVSRLKADAAYYADVENVKMDTKFDVFTRENIQQFLNNPAKANAALQSVDKLVRFLYFCLF